MAELLKVKKSIKSLKNYLRKEANQKGIWEGFGQEEVSKLKDRYFGYAYGTEEQRKVWQEIEDFDEWCMNYEPKS